MKTIFKTAIFLWGLFLVSACVLDSIDSQPAVDPKLECDALESYTIQASKPQDVSFRVNATTPWSVTGFEDAPWISVSPASSDVSSLSEDIRIKTQANTELSDRSVVLTVKGQNVGQTYSIKITQLRKGKLTVTPIASNEVFPAAGGSKTFQIDANQSWEASAADDWLTLSPTNGSSDSEMKTFTVTATAKANSSVTRSTVVTVTSGDDSFEFPVTQQGQTLEIAPVENPVIDRKGGELVLNIDATMDWKVECDNAAFTVTKVGNNQVKISAPWNNQFAERKATVTVKPTSGDYGDVSRSVEITQDINFVLSGNFEVLEDGSVKLFGDQQTRITTVDEYRYVRFTAVLGDKNLESKAQMSCCTHDAGGNTEYQCLINFGDRQRLRSNGPGTDYNSATIDITLDDLKAIKEYRVDFVPDAGNIKLEFFYNGSSRQTLSTRSLFNSDPEATGHYFFGFESASGDGSWYVVKTCDVIAVAE